LNALACSAIAAELSLSAPTEFMNLMIVSTVAMLVGTHGSAARSALPSLAIAPTIAFAAGSVGSAVRLDAMP
jgi:hypothetical protein